MGSVNKVILVGNLGKDPEIKYIKENMPVTKFPLATTERIKNQNGEWEDGKTEWHNIVMWYKQAEIAEKYLKKGKQIYLEGRIRTNSWEDDKGEKKYRTEIIADNFMMLGRKGDEMEERNYGNSDSSENMGSAKQNTDYQENQMEDDLPF
jgi:single-strand DNA-binding protein